MHGDHCLQPLDVPSHWYWARAWCRILHHEGLAGTLTNDGFRSSAWSSGHCRQATAIGPKLIDLVNREFGQGRTGALGHNWLSEVRAR